MHVSIARTLTHHSIFQNSIFILELHYNFVSVIPLQKSGSITYSGHEQSVFCVRRAAAYTSQTDNHIGELTVRETFVLLIGVKVQLMQVCI